ncbi:MAG: LysR family transcriptional regulator [Dolichospermum sp.]
MDEEHIDQLLRRVTLRQIEVLLVLQKHRSMSTAAAELGMSGANVSRVSKRFEMNLGKRIFAGDKRRSTLLEDADEILECLKPVGATIAKLRTNLRNLDPNGVADSPET